MKSDEIIFEGRQNLLKRCFNNFIENSLKYGSEVEIEIKKLRKDIIIDFHDNGSGIPESEYANVFKPFYKIDKSRSKSGSSVGLGLSISQDIIKSHGGRIKLDKSKMGGLKIRVFLPF